ncbi:hypothetical protein MMC07_001334 [Pseudocyphellaria aurata]|nr:hypothetical protein [Pseudocyphellaria aurata]
MQTTKTLLIALGLTASVAAHGVLRTVVAGGITYPADGRIPHDSTKPIVAWKIPEDTDTGFIGPQQYAAPDIICHRNASPATVSAVVEAGDSVQLQWGPWPESHHGPVINYLANCNGPCETVDKTQLKFNKIEAVGLYSNSTIPYRSGRFASDKLREDGNKWTVTIPSTIAKGNYVLRHEIIGLHGAFNPNGAQNYPQCVDLQITGSGTDALASGTLATNFYKADDPGILVSIYHNITYIIPGPPLYSPLKAAVVVTDGTLTSRSSSSLDTDSVTGAAGFVPSELNTRSSSSRSFPPRSQPESSTDTSTSPSAAPISLPQKVTVQGLLDLLLSVVGQLKQLTSSKSAGSKERRHARELVPAMAMVME